MLNFLWLEDQPDTKDKVVEGLEYEFDCKIDFATAIGELLAKLREAKYDLLLLDLRLPHEEDSRWDEIDPNYGFSALSRFHEAHDDQFATPKEVPVLVLSARFDADAQRRASKFGAIKGYLQKPLRFDPVTEGIRKALGDGLDGQGSH